MPVNTKFDLLVSPRTVNVILDELTAKNLLIALTNALQAGGGKKKKKGKKGNKVK